MADKKVARTGEIAYEWFKTVIEGDEKTVTIESGTLPQKAPFLDLDDDQEFSAIRQSAQTPINNPKLPEGDEKAGREKEKTIEERNKKLGIPEIKNLGVAKASVIMINWLGFMGQRLPPSQTIVDRNGNFKTVTYEASVRVQLSFHPGLKMLAPENGLAGVPAGTSVDMKDLGIRAKSISFPPVMRNSDGSITYVPPNKGENRIQRSAKYKGTGVSLYYVTAYLVNLKLFGAIKSIKIIRETESVSYANTPESWFKDKKAQGGGDPDEKKTPFASDDNPDDYYSPIRANVHSKENIIWTGSSPGEVTRTPQYITWEENGEQNLMDLTDGRWS